ncbi:MAG: TIGR03643 family protein, partial [Flavobacteriia bacterium]
MKRTNQTENYCHYSDLPSPLAYVQIKADSLEQDGAFSGEDIDRIIEMAWEDRTPFDAIEKQFGLREADVKALMKRELKFKSYKRWRERVEAC